MKLDLDKIEAAAEASRRTFHAPLISPDELAALVRIARAAVAWQDGGYCAPGWNTLTDALREAGI